MKKTFHVLAALALAMLAAFFAFKTRQFDRSGHERFEAGLRRLKHLDTTFTEEVLKARFEILDNYDDFPGYEQELAQLAVELKDVPGFVNARGKSAIADSLKGFSSLLLKRAEMFEEFKSQNAVLNNSLRYFPTAGEELVRELAGQPDGRDLEIVLNDLLRETLTYSLNPEQDAVGVQRCIEQTASWRTQHPGHSDAPLVASLVAHARTILTRKPMVDALTRDIVSLPTTAKLDETFRVYESNLTRALNRSGFYRGLLCVLGAALVLGVIYAFAALRAINRNLERRVRERTVELSRANEELVKEMAERQKIQSQLLQTSRLAGMAEVATGILHNVGNVLNSVNVSTGIVLDKIVRSKTSGIQKVADLLNGQPDLGSFFSNDPKAKKLPAYLTELARYVAAEQRTVAAEIESLQKHIDHIKDIVATQQGFARVSGVTETLQLQELVEDALKLNASSLARHNLHITKEFSPVPPVKVEKNKVLQILVNLVNNAKQACDAADVTQKNITLRIANGDERVKIFVIDNGIGIPAENLLRIFNHGFTTRKEGHGFGLHNSALAAREMGGALLAHSDGPGHGAIFTLELPLQPPADNRN